jgi:NF-X1-type zinc finger protein NFXL1
MAADDCLICLEPIPATAPTWACAAQCHTLFHLGCVQAYAAASSRPAVHKLLASILSSTAPAVWHCPACRAPQGAYPTEYRCLCGRVREPAFDPYLPAHTCGGVCGRPRASCAHTCTDQCHAGACPKCAALVRLPCWCGKEVLTKRCGQEGEGDTCGNKCGRVGAARAGGGGGRGPGDGAAGDGAAGEEAQALCTHACAAQCHPGACAPCLFPVHAACRCGGTTKMRPCFQRVWSCATVCGRPLACGRHTCAAPCHAGACAPCPNAGPRSCPCGKRAVPAGTPCDAPAPKCGDTCGKRVCGVSSHACERACHEGACGPCSAILPDAPCRCGKSRRRVPCAEGQPLCDKKCVRDRNCGRHQCRRRCCPALGPEPAQPQGSGRSGGVSGSGSGGPDYCPPCREVCGNKLACGNHTCEAFCHPGPCQPCPVTVRLECACTRTAVTVPCGYESRVQPPACTLRCRLPTACHHTTRQPHTCHAGACPPCTQMCGLARGRCGHACPAPCHAAVLGGACPPCDVKVCGSCLV